MGKGKGRGGFPGGMGGGNMSNMIKEAQKMQKQMEEAQEEVKSMQVSETAGGGAVTVTVNGEHQLVDIEIDPEVDDIEMLRDLVIAATNRAMEKLQEEIEKKMSAATGGFGGLGGMF